MPHHIHDLDRRVKLRLERCTWKEYNARVPRDVRDNVVAHLLCRGAGPEIGKIAWCVASCSCADCELLPPMTVAEMRTARRCAVCEGVGDDRSSPQLRGSGWFRGDHSPDSELCSAHARYCDCEKCSFEAKTTPIDAGTAEECVTPFCDAKFHADHVPRTGYCSDCADPEDLEDHEGADSCAESIPSRHPMHPKPRSHAMITTNRRRFDPTDRIEQSPFSRDVACKYLPCGTAAAVTKSMASPSLAPPYRPLVLCLGPDHEHATQAPAPYRLIN